MELPKATIGIPVRQGADYLDQTLKMALGQDYQNLEVVLSDNASTDETATIIDRHARSDSRVKSVAQVRNIGAAENYNEVFRASTAEYFAWNAHDDFASPDFVSSAVKALEADPGAVVAIAKPFRVDSGGSRLAEIPVPGEIIGSDSAAVRFRAAALGDPESLVFGLFRRSVLERTRLHAGFTGSDRNLVAEVMLHGRAVWAGDSEFYLREHENRSVRRLAKHGAGSSVHAREAWYSPARAGKIVFPAWRRLRGYIGAVTSAPLSMWEKVSAYLAVLRLLTDDGFKLSKYLAHDFRVAGTLIVRRLTGGDGAPPTQ